MSQAYLLVEHLILEKTNILVNYHNYIFYTCIRYTDEFTNEYRVICVKGYYPSIDKNIFYSCVLSHENAETVLWKRFGGELYKPKC